MLAARHYESYGTLPCLQGRRLFCTCSAKRERHMHSRAIMHICRQWEIVFQHPNHSRPHEESCGSGQERSEDKDEEDGAPDQGDSNEKRQWEPFGGTATLDLAMGVYCQADHRKEQCDQAQIADGPDGLHRSAVVIRVR